MSRVDVERLRCGYVTVPESRPVTEDRSEDDCRTLRLAVAVALNVVVVGLRLVRESVGGLMDERVPEEEMATIREAIRAHMDGAEEVHALRARHAGRHTFVEFHLVLPGEESVSAAHAVCDRLEAALHEAVPDSSVTIHVEPEEKGKGRGGVIALGSDVPHTFT